MSNANWVADALFGGWQIQGVYAYQSGFPVPFGAYNLTTAVTSGDLFYNGGDPSLSNPTPLLGSTPARFHVDPQRVVSQRDAAQPLALAAVSL